MLGSWGCEEELELGEDSTTSTSSQERQRRESPDSTHPVPDSRVLRYAPSRCHHPPSYSSPHFSTQPPLDCTDCKYILHKFIVCACTFWDINTSQRTDRIRMWFCKILRKISALIMIFVLFVIRNLKEIS